MFAAHSKAIGVRTFQSDLLHGREENSHKIR